MPPRKTAPRANEPLRAFGAENQLIGLSYDGGKTWSQVPIRKQDKLEAPYTRRIAALLPEQGPTPAFQRRMATSLKPLKDANILVGWGTRQTILKQGTDSLGAIIIPIGSVTDQPEDVPALMTSLRGIAPCLFVDLGDRSEIVRAQMPTVMALAEAADALLVPTESIGLLLRKHNANTFTIPPTIDPTIWQGIPRPHYTGKIRVAVQPTEAGVVRQSIDYVMERLGEDKVEFIDDPWMERWPAEDPGFYHNIDVVVVGPPDNRVQMTNISLMAPMAAGCAILADGNYNRTIIHGHSGVLVAKPGPGMWRQELIHLLTNRGFRLKMQRGARDRSRLFENRVNLSRLALPYRMLVKDLPFPVQEMGELI